eukprot:2140811-Lingulodinium_polyedra.AAC.1
MQKGRREPARIGDDSCASTGAATSKRQGNLRSWLTTSTGPTDFPADTPSAGEVGSYLRHGANRAKATG